MNRREILRPKVRQDWASGPADGLQVQFSAEIDGLVHVLAAIVADGSDESLWFEVYVDGKVIQIPFAEIVSAIKAAPADVHSQAWL